MALCSDLSDLMKPADPFYVQEQYKYQYDDKGNEIDGSAEQVSRIINEQISPYLLHFESVDNFLEVVEYAAGREATYHVRRKPGIVNIMNQPFWAAVLNYFLLNY